MIEIKKVTQLNIDDLRRLVAGYTSHAKYKVSKTAADQRVVLTLELEPLAQPYRKRFHHLDAGTLEDYKRMMALGFSFCAYDGRECVGIALAEPRHWNKSLWVQELHVAEPHQQRGIGRQLIGALAEKGLAASLRILVCETQNTNTSAIGFYRKAGFHIEGVDLSHYSNDDYPDGEIALFMKKRLVP